MKEIETEINVVASEQLEKQVKEELEKDSEEKSIASILEDE